MYIEIILIDGKIVGIEMDRYLDLDGEVTVYKDDDIIAVFNKNNIAGFVVNEE